MNQIPAAINATPKRTIRTEVGIMFAKKMPIPTDASIGPISDAPHTGLFLQRFFLNIAFLLVPESQYNICQF